MEERGAVGSGASHHCNALGDRTPCVYFLFLAIDELWFTCHVYRCWWWDPLSSWLRDCPQSGYGDVDLIPLIKFTGDQLQYYLP
jgi:hypothetical protein